jgi:hypothetical protein
LYEVAEYGEYELMRALEHVQVEVEKHLEAPVRCPANNIADDDGEHHFRDLLVRLLPHLGLVEHGVGACAVQAAQYACVEDHDYDHGQEIVEQERVGVEGVQRREVRVEESGELGLVLEGP